MITNLKYCDLLVYYDEQKVHLFLFLYVYVCV